MLVSNGIVPVGEQREGGSEVAVMDERVIGAVSVVPPSSHIETVNVTKSKKVHVGTKVVSITQNVHNKEMLKELPLPQYLWHIVKHSSRTERLSCAAALTALLVCISLIVYFSVKTSKASIPGDSPPHDWNITRDMWLAQPFNHSTIAANMSPVMLVIIQHTVSAQCTVFSQCAAELRNMQSWFIKFRQYDIPYNFLIGNDGRVYEGRGFNIEGAHTFGYNRCSLGVGFIGDYREEIPNHASVTEAQLNRTWLMFQEGVRRGYLRKDFRVVGAKDIQDSASPGSNLHNAIRKWDNFDHQDRFVNMNCEQIQEKYGDVDLSIPTGTTTVSTTDSNL